MKHRHLQRGAASLPLVIGLGILVFLVAISVASVETTRIYLQQANTDGGQALEYARLGTRDALEQLARDRDLGSGTSTIVYAIPMATSGCVMMNACIRIAIDAGSGSSTAPKTIAALGYYRNARRGLQAQIVYDPSRWGAINITSVSETLNPQGL